MNISTPASCGTDSSIKTSSVAEVEVNELLTQLRDGAEVDICLGTVAVAQALAREHGKDLTVSNETQQTMISQLHSTFEGLIQQEVQSNQIINHVQVQVCHVVLGQEFIANVFVQSYGDKAADVILQSPEWLAIFPKPVAANVVSNVTIPLIVAVVAGVAALLYLLLISIPKTTKITNTKAAIATIR